MGNAKEKALGVLGLINVCRQKFMSLCDLSRQLYTQACEKVNSLAVLDNDMGELAGSVKLLEKEAKKPNKLTVKSLKDKLEALKQAFEEEFESLIKLYDPSKELYKEYKGEIKSCCEVYNSLNNTDEEINKGYRSQVKFIQGLIEKFKTILAKFEELIKKANLRKQGFELNYNNAENRVVAL